MPTDPEHRRREREELATLFAGLGIIALIAAVTWVVVQISSP